MKREQLKPFVGPEVIVNLESLLASQLEPFAPLFFSIYENPHHELWIAVWSVDEYGVELFVGGSDIDWKFHMVDFRIFKVLRMPPNLIACQAAIAQAVGSVMQPDEIQWLSAVIYGAKTCDRAADAALGRVREEF